MKSNFWRMQAGKDPLPIPTSHFYPPPPKIPNNSYPVRLNEKPQMFAEILRIVICFPFWYELKRETLSLFIGSISCNERRMTAENSFMDIYFIKGLKVHLYFLFEKSNKSFNWSFFSKRFMIINKRKRLRWTCQQRPLWSLDILWKS